LNFLPTIRARITLASPVIDVGVTSRAVLGRELA
jgi:hypothetical protein